jgi:hypothetical protein
MTNVAYVGIGVAGVIVGLGIVLVILFGMVASLVVPLLVVRVWRQALPTVTATQSPVNRPTRKSWWTEVRAYGRG